MEFLPSDIVTFLQEHGYSAAILAMFLGGIAGSLAAGFVAGLGFFDPWIIWFLAVMVDLVTDIFYYELGRFGGPSLYRKVKGWFGWSEDFLERTEHYFKRHGKKTVFLSKFAQGMGTPTQILAGVAHMPRVGYIAINIVTVSLRSAILVMIGMLAGTAWEAWVKRISDISWFVTGAIVLLIIAFFLYKKFLSWVKKQQQKE